MRYAYEDTELCPMVSPRPTGLVEPLLSLFPSILHAHSSALTLMPGLMRTPFPSVVPFSYGVTEFRTVVINGDPWFVAVDVCRELGLKNPSQVIKVLDDDEKGVHNVETLGGRQKLSIVSEPGFYKLVGRSKKPAAKAFDRWVRHEVLPAILR